MNRKSGTSATKRIAKKATDIRDRFKGCLLGGAVGDALGSPVEFMSLNEIHAMFGEHGIRDFGQAYGTHGAITDDTQMTLFTAEAMIRSYMRSCERGICSPEGVTARAYGRWLLTQGEQANLESFDCEIRSGWLLREKGLYNRRAPGKTCISSLLDKQSGESPAKNDSKGCGAVMRMAPVGLAGWRFGWDTDYVLQLGSSVGQLTHGHPTGHLAAGAFAVIVFELLNNRTLREATENVIRLLSQHKGHKETVTAITNATKLAISTPDRSAVPKSLGEGWVGDEALAIGIYCAMIAESFEEGVVLAVNLDGDSDSTGSIAGNLLGAIHGTAGIPTRWLGPLELKRVIGKLATDLYDCVDWKLDNPANDAESRTISRLYNRYPPN